MGFTGRRSQCITKRKNLILPFYLIARAKGIYRHGGKVDNKILIVKNELEKIIDPKEIRY